MAIWPFYDVKNRIYWRWTWSIDVNCFIFWTFLDHGTLIMWLYVAIFHHDPTEDILIQDSQHPRSPSSKPQCGEMCLANSAAWSSTCTSFSCKDKNDVWYCMILYEWLYGTCPLKQGFHTNKWGFLHLHSNVRCGWHFASSFSGTSRLGVSSTEDGGSIEELTSVEYDQ